MGVVHNWRFYVEQKRGYVGYSMSVRAQEAYERGLMPLSKWTKKAIIDAIRKQYPEYADLFSQFPVAFLKAYVLEEKEWHHTSKLYNETSFYGLDEEYFDELEGPDEAIEDFHRWRGDYLPVLTVNMNPEAYGYEDTPENREVVRYRLLGDGWHIFTASKIQGVYWIIWVGERCKVQWIDSPSGEAATCDVDDKEWRDKADSIVRVIMDDFERKKTV